MKKLNCKITIIVPIYNSEKTLKRCVESVLKQSFEAYELILVNDGSIDSSQEICEEYTKRDSRIQLFKQENKGVSTARNVGIELAKGEYIMFLDADDELSSNALSHLWEKASMSKAEIIFGGIEKIFENQKREDLFPKGGSDFWNNICTHSEEYGYSVAKLFSRKAISEIRFDSRMKSQEDLNFCIRVYQNATAISDIPEVVYFYYYIQSNREPQLYDYLRNQLMLLEIAEKKTTLTITAKEQIQSRIESLIFGILYSAEGKQELNKHIEKINQMLKEEYKISTPFTEKFTRACLDRKRKSTICYFMLRKTAAKLKRLIRG